MATINFAARPHRALRSHAPAAWTAYGVLQSATVPSMERPDLEILMLPYESISSLVCAFVYLEAKL